jgi:hypothetical protein
MATCQSFTKNTTNNKNIIWNKQVHSNLKPLECPSHLPSYNVTFHKQSAYLLVYIFSFTFHLYGLFKTP